MAARDCISKFGDCMSDEVKKVRIQIRAPRGNFGGEIVEAWYCVVDGFLVMTDANGRPVDSEKHPLGPRDDPHIVAHRLLRQRRRGSGPAGWNDPIRYPR